MNRTLRLVSLVAFSLAALQANATTTGDDAYYPAGMRAGTEAPAAAAGTATMTSSARSSYVWRGNEAGLTLETGPAAAADLMDRQAMPQPASATRRESVFLGA